MYYLVAIRSQISNHSLYCTQQSKLTVISIGIGYDAESEQRFETSIRVTSISVVNFPIIKLPSLLIQEGQTKIDTLGRS